MFVLLESLSGMLKPLYKLEWRTTIVLLVYVLGSWRIVAINKLVDEMTGDILVSTCSREKSASYIQNSRFNLVSQS